MSQERRVTLLSVLDIERYRHRMPELYVGFQTERFGIYQMYCTEKGAKNDLYEVRQIRSEPSLDMFTNTEQRYMTLVTKIIYRLLFGAPARTTLQ